MVFLPIPTDAMNRLSSATDGVDTYAYAYNASGDRLQQTVNAVLTNYTLDLAADLTQVLASYGTGSSGYAFTGEMYDSQTGLIYLRARYYTPSNGRFINKDVFTGYVHEPATLHKYNYSNGNPTNFVDPTGYSAEDTQPCSYSFRYCQLSDFHNFTIDVHHFDDSRRLARDIIGFLIGNMKKSEKDCRECLRTKYAANMSSLFYAR